MQQCSNCGHQNRPGVVYCENCGASLLGKPPLSTKSIVSSTEEEKASLGVDSSVLTDVKVQGASAFSIDDTLRLEIEGSPDPIVFKPKAETIFGRRDPATGAMPDIDLTPFAGYRMGVSRRHAAIRQGDEASLNLWDLGSSNGTYLNGQKLNAHRPYRLHDGDELRLGQMMIRCHFQPTPAEAPATKTEEVKPPQTAPLGIKAEEAKPAPAVPPDAKAEEAKPAPAAQPDAKAEEAKPAPAAPPDAKVEEAKPAPAAQPDTQAVEAKPALAAQPEAKPEKSQSLPPAPKTEPKPTQPNLATPSEVSAALEKTGKVDDAPPKDEKPAPEKAQLSPDKPAPAPTDSPSPTQGEAKPASESDLGASSSQTTDVESDEDKPTKEKRD